MKGFVENIEKLTLEKMRQSTLTGKLQKNYNN